MSYKHAFLFVALFLGAAGASAAEYRAGEVIVKYKEGADRSRLKMNAMYDAAGVKSVKRFQGIMKGYEQLILEDGVKVQDAIAELMRNESVEYVQPNYILRLPAPVNEDPPLPELPGMPCIPGFDIPGCDPNMRLPCIIPGLPFPPGCEDDPGTSPTPPPGGGNKPPVQDPPADVDPPVADPDLSQTYGLDKIGAPQAWQEHRGDKQFVVAVIDTGIDYNHEDLSFNVWRNPNPTNGDLVGYDFVHNDGLPFDDHMHGTHTSGTVGAVGGNAKGVSGVAQRVSVMGLKFLSAQGSGTTADAIRAIDYAVEKGAKVLSNSWGGPADEGNQALYDAIERAKDRDVLFVAAAGNDSQNNDGSSPSYPAAFDNDNMLSVAATTQQDTLAFFSNYGKKTTHVGAPGVNIYSTIPGNRYSKSSGTSMACPHVAGAAALLWSKNPTWNYKKVKEVLMKTVDPLPSLDGKTVTGGRINVLKALQVKE